MKKPMESTRKMSKILIVNLVVILSFSQLYAPPMTFTVTTNADNLVPPPGSLREAINLANGNPGFTNTIKFATLSGPIVPVVDLPTVFNPIIIDGYVGSPGGALPNGAPITAANTAIVTIEIQGPGAGFNIPGPLNGLRLGGGSDGSIIRGLVINNFAKAIISAGAVANGVGIRIDSTNNVIEGCFIGCDPTGMVSEPCFNAIRITNDNNTIGGPSTNLAARNLLSGQYGGNGVIRDNGNFTVVEGNTIGLDRSGMSALMRPARIGMSTNGTNGCLISGNAIAGHSAVNVAVTNSDNVLIQNNFIGTNVAGKLAVAPNGMGIWVGESPLNGPTTVKIDSNTISGNAYGIHVGENNFSSLPYYGVQITNNTIGLDSTGTIALPNELDGIWVKFAINTYIAGNVISANGRDGMRIGKGKNTLIRTNFIGTDLSGVLALGNQRDGIRLGNPGVGVEAFGDVIGGAKPGEGNIISNNLGNGIKTVGFVEEETIIGNTITNNGKNGILVGPFAEEMFIGGFRSKGNLRILGDIASQGNANLGPLGTSNFIAGNGENGIAVERSHENELQSNIIGAPNMPNGGDGIRLTNSSDNLIGTKSAGPSTIPQVLGNIITDNGGAGVAVVQTDCKKADDNAILSNSIVDNGKNGIEFIKQ